MGSRFDYVPIQLSRAFREAQSDTNFQSWLKMQDAAVQIEFPIYDLPEIRDQMFTKDSLATVEAKLLELYTNERAAYSDDDSIHRTMRYVYYVGETFRRAFEGTWVALPTQNTDTDPHALRPAIDLPFREGMIKPNDLIGMALNRRSGIEITRVYGHMERLYQEWLENGKPERQFRGTLREQN